ncbi:Ankyrin repeat domain-containing protein 63 [Mactra antiquata]
MVFREETILQVRSFVDKLEQEPRRKSEVLESELLRNSSSSAIEPPTQKKLPVTRQAKSCVASGLFHNVYKGRLKKVQFLLKTGLDINARNDYGYSVLIAALHIENDSKRRRMFEFLLENDADPFQKDPKHKRNALSWAALLGRDEQADMLLDLYMGEFNFHEKDKEGMTALHLATQGGHTEIVKTIVRDMTKYGTSVDIPDNMGLTPYLHAKRLGYGLIADILKVEGGACEGQGDKYSFKRADEWRDIGIKERNEEVRKRRDSQYEQAAIAGSARMLMEFEGPGYEIISIPTPKQKRRPKDVHKRSFSSSDVEGGDKHSSKSVRIISPESNVSAFSRYRHRTSRYDRFIMDNPDGSPQINTMSLIQMREPKRGLAPKQFRSSELDKSKMEEYQHIVGDLATMMDYLAIQHSKSFRRSVPPMKLKQDAHSPDNKRSTLAIIFGGKKGGRKSPRTPGSGKKGRNAAKADRKHGKTK